MSMTRRRIVLPAVISLGSNLGDREQNLRGAVHDISAIDGVTVTAVAGLVESFAVKLEGTDETAPNYLNTIALIDSALHPEQLLVELNRIEAEHGRVRVERWGDRTLDLDIVTFAGMQLDTETLTLPHPRAWQRAFVIVPWLQVDPHAMLPEHGPIADLAVAGSSEVWPYVAAPLRASRVDFGTLDFGPLNE